MIFFKYFIRILFLYLFIDLCITYYILAIYLNLDSVALESILLSMVEQHKYK